MARKKSPNPTTIEIHPMPTMTTSTYEEFAPAQRRQAVDKELELVCQAEATIKLNQATLEKTVVSTVNAHWQQGAALQRACGHEQITFGFVKNIMDKLPWGENPREVFETARARVALTCKIPKPIKNWQDIPLEARRAVLQQMELLTITERAALGDGLAPAPKDPFTFFLQDVTRLKQSLLKCVREKPLAERTPVQLQDFLADTQWLEEQREVARSLLTPAGKQK